MFQKYFPMDRYTLVTLKPEGDALAGGIARSDWWRQPLLGVACAQAALPTPGFHHLHLNSINPAAAIDFYTKQFATTSKTTFAGEPALSATNNVLVLFNKVTRRRRPNRRPRSGTSAGTSPTCTRACRRSLNAA